MQTEPLLYPVNISEADAPLAQRLIALYRGSNGEMASALCYIAQHFKSDMHSVRQLLYSIGREEQRHLVIMNTLITQLAGGEHLTLLGDNNFGRYFTDTGWRAHGTPYALPAVTCHTVYTGLRAELAQYLTYERNAQSMFAKMIEAADDEAVAAPLRYLKKREEAHIRLIQTELNKL